MIDLEPRLLRAFVAIYDLRSVSAAGRHLGVTQPTMSGHLRRLRLHFRDPLFLLAKGGMHPTPRAEEVRAVAAEIVDGLTRLAAVSGTWSPSTSERRFRLMASGYAQTIVSPPLDEAVRRVAPLVGIEFLQPGGWDALPFCDAYVLPAAVVPAAHRTTRLFRDHLTCMAAQRVLSGPKALTLDLFCRLEHVLLAPAPSPPHDAVDAALAARGLTRRVVRITSELAEIRRLLLRSPCLGMLPSRLVTDGDDDLVCAPPPVQLKPIDFMLSWPDIQDDDPGRAWFRRIVASTFARDV